MIHRRKMLISFTILILLGIVVCATWLVYKTFPRSINQNLTGIKYQLGDEGTTFGTEEATVVIKGKLHISLKGDTLLIC